MSINNNHTAISADIVSSNLPKKTLTFVYPEIQKHVKDIRSLNNVLTSMPCFSNGSTRMKPIDCDRSIETFQKIKILTEKVTKLIRTLDGQLSLRMGYRNYGLLMNMYLTMEKISILIDLTKKLRGMSAVNNSERAQICLRTYEEYSCFCTELEKIEKETSLLLKSILLVIAQSESCKSTFVA